MEKYEHVLKQEIDGMIYCKCFKDFHVAIKELGFKFNWDVKLWCIKKEDLTKKIFNDSLEVREFKKPSKSDLCYFYVHYQRKRDVMKTIPKIKCSNKCKNEDFAFTD